MGQPTHGRERSEWRQFHGGALLYQPRPLAESCFETLLDGCFSLNVSLCIHNLPVCKLQVESPFEQVTTKQFRVRGLLPFRVFARGFSRDARVFVLLPEFSLGFGRSINE